MNWLSKLVCPENLTIKLYLRNRDTEGRPLSNPAANTLLNLYRKSHEEMPL